MSNVLCKNENQIGIITINRPEVMNALNKETWLELRDAFLTFEADQNIKVIIVTGSGDKAFVAGADLNALKTRSVTETLKGENTNILRQIELIEKPTIAAINGFALGGGCELAMACDIRIASDKARIGQTEINVGIIPGAGGTQRLTRLVGMGKALELVLTGDVISAFEAKEIGLVNKIVPHEKLMEESIHMAEKIKSKSSLIVSLAKIAIKTGIDADLNTSLVIEKLTQSVVFGTEDHLEGINAFLEKRNPKFIDK